MAYQLIQKVHMLGCYDVRKIFQYQESLKERKRRYTCSVIPSIITADAPRKFPASSLATAAAEALLEFLDKVASTLIFDTPRGGGIHRLKLAAVFCLASGLDIERSKSAMNLSTKLCVDRGL
jgi:hypothetical protein